MKQLNKLQQCRRKLQNLTLSNLFLSDCIDNNVVPKGIYQRIRRSKLKVSPSVERSFIYDEIGKNDELKTYLKKKYAVLLAATNNWLSELDRFRFLRHLVQQDGVVRIQKLNSQRNAINRLKKNRFGEASRDGSKSIVNLSKYELSTMEAFVLSHGLKFAIPPGPSRRELVFSEFESLASQLMHHKPSSTKQNEELHALLYNAAHSYVGTPVDSGNFRMHKECIAAIKSLRQNKSIIITKPDKGSGVVVMERTDYRTKMMKILGDSTKFVEIGPTAKHDRTATIEAKFQDFLKALKDKKLITSSEYEFVRPTGSQLPMMYGLPKTHKSEVPVRPILAMIRSPQHNLAKWLATLLQPVLMKFSSHTLSDSFTFAERIRSLQVDASNVFMCSYDIKSLYTNIPLAETLDICVDQLYNTDLTPPLFSPEVCLELLNKVTTGVEFSFDSKMFQQIDGVAMGSPLGPLLANIFVGYQEEKLFARAQPVITYMRYVDDIFVLAPRREDSELFLKELNNLHPALQFTTEEEIEMCLPFLDVKVERSNGSFLTSIYRKPTFSGEYVHWGSFSPVRRKLNIISCLVERAKKICSPSKLDVEIETILNIFLKLGYPEHRVKGTIKKALSKSTIGIIGPKKCPVYLRLPFIGPPSTRYEKYISSAVEKTFGSLRMRVIFQTRTPFNGRVKDLAPIHGKSNVIYHYKCHCESAYIGKTTQRFHRRRTQHIPVYIENWMKDTSKPPAKRKTKPTAIGQHLLNNPSCAKQYKHERFTYLAQGRNSFHLDVLESLFIQIRKPILCVQKEHVYKSVLFKMLA